MVWIIRLSKESNHNFMKFSWNDQGTFSGWNAVRITKWLNSFTAVNPSIPFDWNNHLFHSKLITHYLPLRSISFDCYWAMVLLWVERRSRISRLPAHRHQLSKASVIRGIVPTLKLKRNSFRSYADRQPVTKWCNSSALSIIRRKKTVIWTVMMFCSVILSAGILCLLYAAYSLQNDS